MINRTFWKGKKVLITGGAGFIGSNLAIRLVRLGAQTTVLDSLLPEFGGNLFNLHPVRRKIRLNISDVRDRYSLKYLVSGQDLIFNLAGQISHTDSMTDPITDLEINCSSQLSLLETVREINPGVKIIYGSTRQLYGKPQYLPVDENHPSNPVDINGIHKLAAEQYHLMYYKVYNIRTISIRMTNTFGPRQLIRHSRQGFVPYFLRLALEGKPITIYKPGDQLRDFNYVSDAVRALLLAGQSNNCWGKVYNLGHHHPYTLKEFAEILLKKVRSRRLRLVDWPDDRKKIDIGSYQSDYSLIRRDLNWSPRVSLEKGLDLTIAFYRKFWDHYA